VDETKKTMMPMRFSYFYFMLLLPVAAGNFNVVHVAGEKELTIEVSCDKRTQSFPLAAGADSGTFTLPEKPAVFTVKDSELKPWDAEASKEGRVAILHHKENKLQWHIMPSQPATEKSSLRLINLSDGAVGLMIGEKRYELPPDQFLELGELEKNQVSATLDGQKKQSTGAEEPTAFIATIYNSANGPKLRFIADR
jgi:hypothetical protein